MRSIGAGLAGWVCSGSSLFWLWGAYVGGGNVDTVPCCASLVIFGKFGNVGISRMMAVSGTPLISMGASPPTTPLCAISVGKFGKFGKFGTGGTDEFDCAFDTFDTSDVCAVFDVCVPIAARAAAARWARYAAKSRWA